MRAAGGAPQQDETDHHEEIRGGVEEAIAERVDLQVANVVRWVGHADHVVPLEHLVQDDPVEETTDAHA
jgi:hypothetical protein